MLRDAERRSIDHLRISLTDRCQLRCRYCMPPEGVEPLEHGSILRYEEIEAFLRVALSRGIRSVRLTGGEPLLRRGVVDFVARIAAMDGLEDLSLTTNGLLLASMASALKAAGLRRVNIGLSSLDPARYRELTRGGELGMALAGLEAALAAGLGPVKVNVVLLRGLTEDPAPFLELTRRLPVEVRFIEYMPMGAAPSSDFHLEMARFHERLEALGPFEPLEASQGQGPARDRRRLPGSPGSFAIIPGASGVFCHACNRLRLTSDGHLRLCLYSGQELDLKPALRPQVQEAVLGEILAAALLQKPPSMAEAQRSHARRMSQIGG